MNDTSAPALASARATLRARFVAGAVTRQKYLRLLGVLEEFAACGRDAWRAGGWSGYVSFNNQVKELAELGVEMLTLDPGVDGPAPWGPALRRPRQASADTGQDPLFGSDDTLPVG